MMTSHFATVIESPATPRAPRTAATIAIMKKQHRQLEEVARELERHREFDPRQQLMIDRRQGDTVHTGNGRATRLVIKFQNQ